MTYEISEKSFAPGNQDLDSFIADIDRCTQADRLHKQIEKVLARMKVDAYKAQFFTTTPYCHDTHAVYS